MVDGRPKQLNSLSISYHPHNLDNFLPIETYILAKKKLEMSFFPPALFTGVFTETGPLFFILI